MKIRAKIAVRGAVQGVGFRPFVYRLARELDLAGWVLNSGEGVFIEVEGERSVLDLFIIKLEREKPTRSFIQSLEFSFLDVLGYGDFEIRHSDERGGKSAIILPDIATCPDCLREVFDPHDRRYLYPFTNCTNCGPRFSIITALPYDRANTSMKEFIMCADCRAEYENPADRRFHAQPNACPVCGPHVELWLPDGSVLAEHHEAIHGAVKRIRTGEILALKGLGGFLLIADARNEESVRRLREHKHREEKPLALLFPTLESVRGICEVSSYEERLLLSPESPIVLLERKETKGDITALVAPNNPCLGIMLPYTPLHHLLMREIAGPVVATSGNISDEPMCIDEHEALERLQGIADVFLVHNRPIIRHVDDSIVRVVLGREQVQRRARGFAPLPVSLQEEAGPAVLAVGAHLKNSVALRVNKNVFISQHIGDLETKEAYSAFQRVVGDFQDLYDVKPEVVACDMHPGYLSTQYASNMSTKVVPVQHHYAHIASCMGENELLPPVLGVSWDGTGYGPDGTIWGGEFLLVTGESFERVAHFQPFMLPGGDAAIKEPRRTALGALYEMFGDELTGKKELNPVRSFAPGELNLVLQMLQKRLNSPRTSSAGRLFDVVASLIGCRQHTHFEGQAAMELEFMASGVKTEALYEFQLRPVSGSPAIVDWVPLLQGVLDDISRGIPGPVIGAKFHNTLTEIIVAVAGHAGQEKIALTGGCFQNKYLTERTVRRLEVAGFRPYWHQRLPANDGGIAFGQVVAALRSMSFNRIANEAIVERT